MKTAIPVRRQLFVTFLREWLEFALAHPPGTDMENVNHAYIEPAFGLCGNFRQFLTHECKIRENGSDWYTTYCGWLERQFTRDGLNHFYPFGEDVYEDHTENKTHHLVPSRVEWVRKYIEQHS